MSNLNLRIKIDKETMTMSSVDLARLCVGNSKDAHSNFIKKAKKVLGESLLVKFYEQQKYVKNQQGAIGYRTIYRLPERESMLMAMSYSYELQAQIYDEWTKLKEMQYDLTSGNEEEAKKNAIKMSIRDMITMKRPGRLISKLLEKTESPLIVTENILDGCQDYKMSKEQRSKIYNSLISCIESYDTKHRKHLKWSERVDFDRELDSCIKAVNKRILLIEKRRHNIELKEHNKTKEMFLNAMDDVRDKNSFITELMIEKNEALNRALKAEMQRDMLIDNRQSVSFTLNIHGFSTNSMYENSMRTYVYRKWTEDAESELDKINIDLSAIDMSKPLEIQYVFDKKSKFDVDNLIKSVQDLLAKRFMDYDDNIVHKVIAEKGKTVEDYKDGKIHITLRPLAP